MKKSIVLIFSFYVIFCSFKPGKRAAIRHKYFKEPKPIAYEWQYDMAMDNLLTWATKRIAA